MIKAKHINKKWKYFKDNSKNLSTEDFFNLDFPGGNFYIDKELNFLVNTTTGKKLGKEDLNKVISAHPIYFMIITLRGSGASIQDIFDLLNYDKKNGPMLGQCNMSFNSQLKVDYQYNVKGKINSLVEKDSKKLGKIKILDFSLSVYDSPTLNIGDVNYVWILPLGKKNEI